MGGRGRYVQPGQLRERMRLTRFSRPTRRTVSLQSVGNLWAPTASDIEGPTDLDWVSLCFETEISRCALDSCMALELSVNRQCLSKCGEPSSGVTTLRCNPRDRVPPRRPRASAGGLIAADPSDDGPQRHGHGIDNRCAFCRTQ